MGEDKGGTHSSDGTFEARLKTARTRHGLDTPAPGPSAGGWTGGFTPCPCFSSFSFCWAVRPGWQTCGEWSRRRLQPDAGHDGHLVTGLA
jgi:hypothetical protein